MRLLRADRLFKILLAFVAATLLGVAVMIWVRLPLAPSAPPPLPQWLEWQSDPQSGAVSLLLHGLDGQPGGGVLVPILSGESAAPGLPEVWRELFATRPRQAIFSPEQRDGFDGLQMFSVVQQPGSLPLALQPLPGFPLNVAVRDQQLWLACARSGLSVLRLDDPLKPELRKAWAAPWAAYVAFAGNLVFLLDADGRLEVVEVAHSGQARLVARQSLHQTNIKYLGLTAHRGRLLLLKSNLKSQQLFLQSRDFAPGGQPALAFTEVSLPARANRGCWWRDGRLYLNDNRGRLLGIDVGNPMHPQVFLDVVLPAQIDHLVWSGHTGLAQLADGRVYAVPGEPMMNKGWAVRYLGHEQEGIPAFLVFAAGRLYTFSQKRGIEVFPALPVPPADRTVPVPSPAETFAPGDLWSREVLQVVTVPTGFAVLETGGRVRFVSTADGRMPMNATLETGEESRWLAVYGDRLYVGGGAELTVLRTDEKGGLLRAGAVAFPGEESFDAVVLDGTLCVAAGHRGLVVLSLANPDRPLAQPLEDFPPLLQQRLDVKALAVHGDQLFAAGGAAGLLTLAADRTHGVKLIGVRPVAAPVHAVAAVGNLLLAATNAGIELLAMLPSVRSGDLQSLEMLPIKNGMQLVVLGNGHFGVRQAEGEWQFLPLPVLLSGQAGKPPRLLIPATAVPGGYRLVLFNRAGVIEWPAVLAVPAQNQVPRRAG